MILFSSRRAANLHVAGVECSETGNEGEAGCLVDATQCRVEPAVTAGDEQGSRRLRATFNQQEAARADELASDYSAKYAPLQASRAGWWIRATDLLSRIWPGLVVLGFFVAARRYLTQKLLFVVVAIVVAFAFQYLALSALSLLMNSVMMRFPDQMLNAVVWTFGLAFVLSLVAPSLGYGRCIGFGCAGAGFGRVQHD